MHDSIGNDALPNGEEKAVSTQEEQWEDDQKQPDQELQQPQQQKRQHGRTPESAAKREREVGTEVQDTGPADPPTSRPSTSV